MVNSKLDKIEGLGVDGYDIDAWLERLGSMPVERVAHADHSESYESNLAHVFRLENGQYALVTERGCSCYSSEDASIDLFPDEASALEKFRVWDKQNRGNPL